MVNKERCLNLLEAVENTLKNIKSSVNRNSALSEEVSEKIEKLEDQLENLKMIVEAEPGNYLNRSYEGL